MWQDSAESGGDCSLVNSGPTHERTRPRDHKGANPETVKTKTSANGRWDEWQQLGHIPIIIISI